MALYESLSEQNLTPAAAAEQSQAHFLAIPRVGSLAEALRLVLVGLLMVCWIAGSYAGVVYWSIQGSLGGVILSVIVPGFGAASTAPLYVWLGSGS